MRKSRRQRNLAPEASATMENVGGRVSNSNTASDARIEPSGLKMTLLNCDQSSTSVCLIAPVAASHRRIVFSALALASVAPSGLKAIHRWTEFHVATQTSFGPDFPVRRKWKNTTRNGSITQSLSFISFGA